MIRNGFAAAMIVIGLVLGDMAADVEVNPDWGAT